jgi:hypothetical protein
MRGEEIKNDLENELISQEDQEEIDRQDQVKLQEIDRQQEIKEELLVMLSQLECRKQSLLKRKSKIRSNRL